MGEAIAAGMPEDRMPIVSSDGESADATFNTPDAHPAPRQALRRALRP